MPPLTHPAARCETVLRDVAALTAVLDQPLAAKAWREVGAPKLPVTQPLACWTTALSAAAVPKTVALLPWACVVQFWVIMAEGCAEGGPKPAQFSQPRAG